MTIKNLRMCPAIGGYIVKYDEYKQTSNDDYDGERYIGEKKVVATDSDEAIKIMDELFQYSNDSMDVTSHMPSEEPMPLPKGTDLMKHG